MVVWLNKHFQKLGKLYSPVPINIHFIENSLEIRVRWIVSQISEGSTQLLSLYVSITIFIELSKSAFKITDLLTFEPLQLCKCEKRKIVNKSSYMKTSWEKDVFAGNFAKMKEASLIAVLQKLNYYKQVTWPGYVKSWDYKRGSRGVAHIAILSWWSEK